MFWFILFGWLSDRVGRKTPIVIGYALTIVLMFPLVPLDGVGGQSRAGGGDAQRNPVVVTGQRLHLQSLRPRARRRHAAELLDALTRSSGIAYSTVAGARLERRRLAGDGSAESPVDAADPAALDAGARRSPATSSRRRSPTFGQALQVVLAIVVIGLLSGMTYGPVAALLVEMFPARIRYTSHVGPLSYRHRLFRRLPALHQPVYRRPDRRSLRRPLVHDRRWWRWRWSSPSSGCRRRRARSWNERCR